MRESTKREKLLDEVNRIPDSKLAEVYEILHDYRLGIESTEAESPDVMQYAGIWADMPEDEFGKFLQDIRTRRQQAFSHRRSTH